MQFSHYIRAHINCAAFIALIFLIAACNDSRSTSPEAKIAFDRVIPKPTSANATGKTFLITSNTTIVVDSSVIEMRDLANYLVQNLKTITGLSLDVSSEAKESAILLTLKGGSSSLGDEGYELQIDEEQVKIIANKPAGVFHGIQTLRQIIADKDDKASRSEWEVATGTITARCGATFLSGRRCKAVHRPVKLL
jgi:hexosaminidase